MLDVARHRSRRPLMLKDNFEAIELLAGLRADMLLIRGVLAAGFAELRSAMFLDASFHFAIRISSSANSAPGQPFISESPHANTRSSPARTRRSPPSGCRRASATPAATQLLIICGRSSLSRPPGRAAHRQGLAISLPIRANCCRPWRSRRFAGDVAAGRRSVPSGTTRKQLARAKAVRSPSPAIESARPGEFGEERVGRDRCGMNPGEVGFAFGVAGGSSAAANWGATCWTPARARRTAEAKSRNVAAEEIRSQGGRRGVGAIRAGKFATKTRGLPG